MKKTNHPKRRLINENKSSNFHHTFIDCYNPLRYSVAENNTQVGLPEGAIARFRKGGINLMRFSSEQSN